MSERSVLKGLPDNIGDRSIVEVIAQLNREDFTYDEAKRLIYLMGYDVDGAKSPGLHPRHEAVGFSEPHTSSPYLDSFLVRCSETIYEEDVPAVTIDSLERFLDDNRLSSDLEASSTVRSMRRHIISGELEPRFNTEDSLAIVENDFNIAAVEAIQFIHSTGTVKRLGTLATGLRAELAIDKYSKHISEALRW